MTSVFCSEESRSAPTETPRYRGLWVLRLGHRRGLNSLLLELTLEGTMLELRKDVAGHITESLRDSTVPTLVRGTKS